MKIVNVKIDDLIASEYNPRKWSADSINQLKERVRAISAIKTEMMWYNHDVSYQGVIIEESLSNKDILSDLNIVSTEIEDVTEKHATPWLEQWTLDTIEIPENEIDDMAEHISKSFDNNHISNWYADFKNDEYHYVIFPNKVFKLDRNKKVDYEEMTEYGISIGVPAYQIPSFELNGQDEQAIKDLQKISYEVGDRSGNIFWAASKSFGELVGKTFKLGEMEAVAISKRDGLSDIGKILLSAVAGAVIQHLIDDGASAADIFQSGTMEVK